MKLKDLSVRQVLVLKYMACKFIMETFKPDPFLDRIIGDLTKERLGEKHSIPDYANKNLDEIVSYIAKDSSKEERSDLISTTYDYIVNKLFSIEQSDSEDPDNFFPESLIIRPKYRAISDKMYGELDSYVMQVMDTAYFKLITSSDDIKIRKTMFASTNDTKEEFTIVVM